MKWAFSQQSKLIDDTLALALAPALTPTGIIDKPSFFTGTALYSQVLARSLLVLADITSTRYFQYTPVTQRDPILSAQGDRLRAEVFSACNSVYARLDLLQQGFDGQISRGTTNVDIGIDLRQALAQVNTKDKLHLNIGNNGLVTRHVQQKESNATIATLKTVIERPVEMPSRWIRALGNAAEIHKNMSAIFTLKGIQAQTFIATLPAATGKNQMGWLVPSRTGVKLMSRGDTTSVYISGLHRLSALKRLVTNITGLTFYRQNNGEQGPCMIEAHIPGARLTLSLTSEAWQGYSGEGALLESLAPTQQLQDAQMIKGILQFDALISQEQLSTQTKLDKQRINSALAYLAVSGKLGFDTHEEGYFHRELPEAPNRIMKDNPRLKSAHKLIEQVEKIDENTWIVHSKNENYRVHLSTNAHNITPQCTCTWYLRHQMKRGPCKHILAVQLKEDLNEC